MLAARTMPFQGSRFRGSPFKVGERRRRRMEVAHGDFLPRTEGGCGRRALRETTLESGTYQPLNREHGTVEPHV